MSQSQPLRIENAEYGSFGTSRTINSLLWFVNCANLENAMLGYLGKYREKHGVKLYAYAPQGNHHHLLSEFPRLNRAGFYRDFNARYAEGVRKYVAEFSGGPVFERRYSEQAVPLPDDMEEAFFYCALQSVHAGLVEKPSDYPAYNSFQDAISGKKRRVRVVDWAGYNAAKRKNPSVPIKNFYQFYELQYERLPGYEQLSQKEYRDLMLRKHEERRLAIVNAWKAKRRTFYTKDELRSIRPGSAPKQTKKSGRYSKRPLVLTKCREARQRFLEWYFAIYNAYKVACKKYLTGDIHAVFPPRTYRPPGLLVPG